MKNWFNNLYWRVTQQNRNDFLVSWESGWIEKGGHLVSMRRSGIPEGPLHWLGFVLWAPHFPSHHLILLCLTSHTHTLFCVSPPSLTNHNSILCFPPSSSPLPSSLKLHTINHSYILNHTLNFIHYQNFLNKYK